MRHTLLTLLLTIATLSMAENYVIVFATTGTENDGGAVTAVADIVSTASDNMVVSAPQSVNIYRGKTGYGIKGGKGSGKGELTLRLDQTYYPDSIIVYAATYGSDKTNLLVNGNEIALTGISEIKSFSVPVSVSGLDTIRIEAKAKNNNRFYVQKIEFSCSDPNPDHAKITVPQQMKFSAQPFIQDEPVEDLENLTISARCVNEGGIQISLKKSNKSHFQVSPSLLPAEGGEISISYTDTMKSRGTFNDSLIIQARGADNQIVRHAVAVQLTYYAFTPTPVDSTGMVIGPFSSRYYETIEGKQDSALKSTLATIVNCGVRYRYGSGTHKTWDAFYYTDRDTTTDEVLDMYSDNLRFFDSDRPTASVPDFDIEHMFPKSWWGGDVNKAYQDLFHLVPGDYSANRSKSNHGPGIPTDTTFWNGSFATGADTVHGLQRVFCPADEYKGDFARAYFYIACCYGDELKWVEEANSEPLAYLDNSDWHEFRPWVIEILLGWHRMDAVSEKEKARAIEVNKIQGNRNPFIDYPELVEYIWGEHQGEAVHLENLVPTYPDTPTRLTSAQDHPKAVRILRDGQICIMREGKTYTLFGQTIR